MPNALTINDSNGGSAGTVQPVADSVTGSPFSVDSTTAQNTGPSKGVGFVVYTDQPIHIHFSKEGAVVDADSNDMILPAGEWHVLPTLLGDVLSFLADNTSAVVYVEAVKEA